MYVFCDVTGNQGTAKVMMRGPDLKRGLNFTRESNAHMLVISLEGKPFARLQLTEVFRAPEMHGPKETLLVTYLVERAWSYAQRGSLRANKEDAPFFTWTSQFYDRERVSMGFEIESELLAKELVRLSTD